MVAKCLNKLNWFSCACYQRGQLLCIRWESGSAHRKEILSQMWGVRLRKFLALAMPRLGIPVVAEFVSLNWHSFNWVFANLQFKNKIVTYNDCT